MDESQPAPEVQRHHPAARRRALLIGAAVVVIGGAAILALEPYLDRLTRLADRDPQEALRQLTFLIKLITVGIIVPMFALLAWLLVLSRRVYRAERFPPPGMAVARDTQILYGRRARVRAWTIAVIALALGATSIALPVILWRTLDIVQEKIEHLHIPVEAPRPGATSACRKAPNRRPH